MQQLNMLINLSKCFFKKINLKKLIFLGKILFYYLFIVHKRRQ